MTSKRDIDQPLRDDVGFLGRVLGSVLAEQEGSELLVLEERVRRLAIQRRREPHGKDEAAAELATLLSGLSLERATVVIRAFATYFRLVNLAEQHHRIRRAREHAREVDAPPQRGSLASILCTARDSGVSASKAREAIRTLEVTLTFTAHPTEAARRTVLEKLYRVARTLEDRDRGWLTPQEEAESLEAVREEVTSLWQTDELRRARPTVGDEVKNVLWYVEEVLWRVLPEVPQELARAFELAYGERLDVMAQPIRIHSWVGGDMDGNPFVVPEVIEDALRTHRVRGLRRLLHEVRLLGSSLSQSTRYVRASDPLLASIEMDAAALPDVAAKQGPRTIGEPWRKKLRFIEARLEATLARTGHEAAPSETDRRVHYSGSRELEADLALLADSLHAARSEHAGERKVRTLLNRVRTTGFHIAELEVRTPAKDVVSAMAFVNGTGPATEGGTRILNALRVIERAQAEGGPGACRTLILSMCEGAADVLAALECARHVGLWDNAKQAARIDIVPLFETHSALELCADALRTLFTDPTYRKHLAARGVQEVMMGYSDSGKEIGLLAATVALRRAQAILPGLTAEFGVPIRVFHGRGESVARGGGPLQKAILALPAGSVGGRYKATEQGEALDHKYGRPAIAIRTLELVIGGALLHSLGAEREPSAEAERRYAEVFDELANEGKRAYRSLVWEDPHFVTFFKSATPLDAIAQLPIGSRPSKRGAGGLEVLRAIPWVFAWTQSRAILPGWYGVGSALEAVGSKPGGLEILREMRREWPFFEAVLENVEMVLAKTDIDIAARYAELAPDAAREAIWPRIQAEHARTEDWVKRVLDTKELLERDPALGRSIELRNPYLDPMSFLQIELLRRGIEPGFAGERPLLLTINGIAAGMRNTG